MVKFEVSIDIDCSPDIVVQALMKAENATYWTTDLEEFEVMKGKPGEVGAIGRLHYVFKNLIETRGPDFSKASEQKGSAQLASRHGETQ
ncbi:MAG TPA: hypothetical protein VMW53_05755 [archaeon]|nr:hypothetical protein [archaeon]